MITLGINAAFHDSAAATRNVNTLGPRACHDEGKRCAETLCCDCQRPPARRTGMALAKVSPSLTLREPTP